MSASGLNEGVSSYHQIKSHIVISDESEDYIMEEIFPILTCGIQQMIHVAKNEKCFERKITKFRPLDFLTEYLFNNNPKQPRRYTKFEDIDFVKTYLRKHPRLPVPKFLTWTEEEATRIIQAYYRGYLVRRQPQVQELRDYQREMRIRTILRNQNAPKQ